MTQFKNISLEPLANGAVECPELSIRASIASARTPRTNLRLRPFCHPQTFFARKQASSSKNFAGNGETIKRFALCSLSLILKSETMAAVARSMFFPTLIVAMAFVAMTSSVSSAFEMQKRAKQRYCGEEIPMIVAAACHNRGGVYSARKRGLESANGKFENPLTPI